MKNFYILFYSALLVLAVPALHAQETDIRADDGKIGYSAEKAVSYTRDIDQWTSLTLAVVEGDRAGVETALKNDEDIQEPDYFGRTALMLAVMSNRIELAALLLEHSANPNTTDTENHTPLLAAIANDNEKMAQMLLEHKANLEYEGQNWTESSLRYSNPLMLASIRGNTAIASMLISRGANVNGQNQFGWTPLHFAAHEGRVELVKLLLEKGANIHAGIKSNPISGRSSLETGSTPLHHAAAYGQLAVVQVLLEHGAAVNSKDHHGQTPLESLEGNENLPEQKKEKCRRFLIAHGAIATREKKSVKAVNPPPKIESLEIVNPSTDADNPDQSLPDESTETSPETPAVKTLAASTLATTVTQIDIGNYSIRKLAVTTESLNHVYPSTSYYLVFPGCLEPIYLDNTEKEFYTTNAARAKLKWLEPGKIMEVTWDGQTAGHGQWMDEKHLILMVEGMHVQPVLRAGVNVSGRYSMSDHVWGGIKFAWNSALRKLEVTTGESEEIHKMKPLLLMESDTEREISDGLEPGYHSYSISTKTVYHYRLDHEQLLYMDGREYALGLAGFPLVDVAQKYSMSLMDLLKLNPELKGKVYCDRKILLKDSVPEPKPWRNVRDKE